MTTTTQAAQTTQVYQVFIKASPEAIWEAITTPEFTRRYFYEARIEVTPERYRSVGPDGSDWGDDPTFEYDPPRRLVHGWRSLYDPELADEAMSRVTWEIEPQEGGYCLLTVTHDQLEGALRPGHDRRRGIGHGPTRGLLAGPDREGHGDRVRPGGRSGRRLGPRGGRGGGRARRARARRRRSRGRLGAGPVRGVRDAGSGRRPDRRSSTCPRRAGAWPRARDVQPSQP